MDKSADIVGFIPARAQSSRFPGKPLADILGKPMIVRVWERVSACKLLSRVYVATDSKEIFEAASECGAQAVMTYEEHASGSDRVAEACRTLKLAPNDVVVNVQGDQPLMDVTMIEEVVEPLIEDKSIPMTTLIYRILRDEEIHHPNAVKTVFDSYGFALYFSRSTIPYPGSLLDRRTYFKHHGIYAFRNDFLQKFSQLPVSNLERIERLEQLRVLENGFKIKVVITDKDSVEVDTPEDLERVRQEYLSLG